MFSKSISASLALGFTLTAILSAAACGGDDEDSAGAAGSSGSGGSGGSSGAASGGSSGSATGGTSGSATGGTGGAAGGGQTMDCKGTSCMAPAFGSSCCAGANADKCGVDLSQFVDSGGGCVERDQPGNADPSCDLFIGGGGEAGPDAGRRIPGCCRPEGVCGAQVPTFGCADISQFVDSGATRSCTPM